MKALSTSKVTASTAIFILLLVALALRPAVKWMRYSIWTKPDNDGKHSSLQLATHEAWRKTHVARKHNNRTLPREVALLGSDEDGHNVSSGIIETLFGGLKERMSGFGREKAFLEILPPNGCVY